MTKEEDYFIREIAGLIKTTVIEYGIMPENVFYCIASIVNRIDLVENRGIHSAEDCGDFLDDWMKHFLNNMCNTVYYFMTEFEIKREDIVEILSKFSLMCRNCNEELFSD